MNALGYPGNETTKKYFKDLVSFSKTICSFRYKKNTVFEGMYGFVGKEYFHLVNPWCGSYYPYHWQYLKTQPTIIGNEDNQYSRANAMNFLRGNKRSKIIHHFSSIAWFSLCKFCQQAENSEYMKIIRNAIACVMNLVGKQDILINQDEKKIENW